MNKRQKEILEELLADEKRTLEELEESYDDALAQINGRIEALLARQDADMQYVIYQVEYQRQLKTQVQAILETLQSNEFDTISQYLTRAYENGFMGTMYDLHGQGIPMIFPIDQAQVADAIRHQTKLSSTLYTALGLDINDLSKKIAGEISRGMSSGQGYDEMARNISAWARIPQNNAMRIARTEAHRIQCRAAMDAQYKAKDKGADVVKQWDAALDGVTRPNHRKLDGQIRELDEPFEVGGMKAMYPGDFGDPAEDCNCRCAILQRARWALDSSELETLRQRAEAMGEYDSYNEFRDSYNKALNELFEDSQPVRSSVQKMDIFEEQRKNRDVIDKTLQEVENERKSLEYEVGTILDRRGNIINVTGGEAHSVSPPEDLLKDNIFTHNHPSGGCFSVQDIESMIETQLLELRASTPQGIYYSLLRQGAVPDNIDFALEYRNAFNITLAMDAVESDLEAGILTRKEVEEQGWQIYVNYQSRLGIEWLEENAERYGYVFTRGEI